MTECCLAVRWQEGPKGPTGPTVGLGDSRSRLGPRIIWVPCARIFEEDRGRPDVRKINKRRPPTSAQNVRRGQCPYKPPLLGRGLLGASLVDPTPPSTLPGAGSSRPERPVREEGTGEASRGGRRTRSSTSAGGARPVIPDR